MQISQKGTCEHAPVSKAYYVDNAISAVHVSGVPRFCTDLEVMLGTSVNIYFKICWYAVSPLAVFVSTLEERSIPIVFENCKNSSYSNCYNTFH